MDFQCTFELSIEIPCILCDLGPKLDCYSRLSLFLLKVQQVLRSIYCCVLLYEIVDIFFHILLKLLHFLQASLHCLLLHFQLFLAILHFFLLSFFSIFYFFSESVQICNQSISTILSVFSLPVPLHSVNLEPKFTIIYLLQF